MREESGAQENSATPAGAWVSRRASPPLAGMSQTWRLPFASARRKAMVSPSGEKRGAPSLGPAVNGRGSPPGSSMRSTWERDSPDSRSTQERVKARRLPSGEMLGSATVVSS